MSKASCRLFNLAVRRLPACFRSKTAYPGVRGRQAPQGGCSREARRVPSISTKVVYRASIEALGPCYGTLRCPPWFTRGGHRGVIALLLLDILVLSDSRLIFNQLRCLF